MTFCIGWRKDNLVQFAADSRITATDGEYIDIAIKVLSVPVMIKDPVHVGMNESSNIYDHKIGMLFSGDTTTTFLLKEAISELLPRLQVFPGTTDFSFNGICEFVKSVLVHTANKIRQGFRFEVNVEFLLGGYCPEKKNIRVFKFLLVDDGRVYEAMVDEILFCNDDDYEMFGSGRPETEAWEEEFGDRSFTDYDCLKLLKDACEDPNEESVGGPLQYGRFVNNNFEILGVADFKVGPDQMLKNLYPLRGTYLYEESIESTVHGFHVQNNFITPFQRDANDYLDSLI